MESHILTAATAAPIITALVAAIGLAIPQLPRRAYPLAAIALGIAWCTIIAAANNNLGWPTLIEGVVAGLAASGLYSAAIKPLGQSYESIQHIVGPHTVGTADVADRINMRQRPMIINQAPPLHDVERGPGGEVRSHRPSPKRPRPRGAEVPQLIT